MLVTYTGDLVAERWISLVDVTLNGNNPCVAGSLAAHAANTVHSGAVQAAAGTTEITIPQTTLLDATKTFTVCYSESTGTVYDETWRDSYIHLVMSKIETVSAHLLTHWTTAHIANHVDVVVKY